MSHPVSVYICPLASHRSEGFCHGGRDLFPALPEGKICVEVALCPAWALSVRIQGTWWNKYDKFMSRMKQIRMLNFKGEPPKITKSR